MLKLKTPEGWYEERGSREEGSRHGEAVCRPGRHVFQVGKVDLSRVYLDTALQPWDNITPRTSTSEPSQKTTLSPGAPQKPRSHMPTR